MKKYFVIVLSLLLSGLSGCATYNLEKTIWFNISPVIENEGVKGNVVTSLYFMTDTNVDFYASVIVDSTVIVHPYMMSRGTYSTSGKPRKEAQISITAVDMQNETVKYNGAFRKTDGMFLMSHDSIVRAYNFFPNAKLP